MAEVVIRLTDSLKQKKVNIEFEFYPPITADGKVTQAQLMADHLNNYMMAQGAKVK